MKPNASHPLRNALREFYDKTALDREAGTVADWKIEVRANFLTLLQKEQKRTLLEVGAGVGRDSLFFRENGLEVACIDLSPAMVALCRQKGLDAQVMDVAGLDFPDESFDAIYSMNSLLHLPKTEFPGALAQIRRVLKPGGLFFLGVYGGDDHEGIREEDYAEPKRFFSSFSDEHIQREAARVFDILSFRAIDCDCGASLHFQALILKKEI
ncbi:methylase [Longilinea arvoryzae]|uniref:Methylase n=1 Tax=Longilinea arvoryzae TaxID=360412 RepID=A0A0S7BEU0_9CHLR|nr:class I SAM-dependent methyltransferase [Longilinea arvoryzae]GAP12530.1 methylase [Longilinea arvoryzae]